jgi:hypothetical protein
VRVLDGISRIKVCLAWNMVEGLSRQNFLFPLLLCDLCVKVFLKLFYGEAGRKMENTLPLCRGSVLLRN